MYPSPPWGTTEKFSGLAWLEQAHHGNGNGALLNELDEALKDIFAVGIEAQDEAPHHFDAVLLDDADALQQVAPRVLQLVVGDQAVLVRGLDAQEDGYETGVF